MKAWKKFVVRATCCGLMVATIPGALRQAAAEDSAPGTAQLPDSPGAIMAKSQQTFPMQTASGTSSSAGPSGQPPASQAQPSSLPLQAQSSPAPSSQGQSSQPPSTGPHPPQPSRERPVGTAAAGSPYVSGVAVSEPAGVAIAPAKQRRVRTIMIRMGALVGAGVALGSVAALTQATPSKPPGAH